MRCDSGEQTGGGGFEGKATFDNSRTTRCRLSWHGGALRGRRIGKGRLSILGKPTYPACPACLLPKLAHVVRLQLRARRCWVSGCDLLLGRVVNCIVTLIRLVTSARRRRLGKRRFPCSITFCSIIWWLLAW